MEVKGRLSWKASLQWDIKFLAAHASEFRFDSLGDVGSTQVFLSIGLTWQRMGGKNTLGFHSGSLIRKEIFGPFGSSSITRGEPRV